MKHNFLSLADDRKFKSTVSFKVFCVPGSNAVILEEHITSIFKVEQEAMQEDWGGGGRFCV
jgi:hypothetical protein